MNKHENFVVYRVFYDTYENIESNKDKKKVLVAMNLTWVKAKELVNQLGFGHAIYEE